jgi:hypothetical protein
MAEIPYDLISKMIVLAVIIYGIIYFMNTTPSYSRVNEGFFGGVAVGSGHPDCLRTLPEGSQLLDVFQSHKVHSVSAGVSDASADYNELELLLSKMACLKKDLLAPGSQVDATRYQAFETTHDRVSVAELCGLCLSQNISARDLDISFATWRDRGKELLRRLCTSGNLSEQEVDMTEKLFKNVCDDVYNIATSRCVKTDFSKQHGGHTLGDVGGFEPPHMQELRPYDYLYGGLSASGWNGAV